MPYPLARLRVARFPSSWSGRMALWMGGSPPHSSLIPEEPSTYQPARHLIQGQRAAFGSPSEWSPNTVLIFGGS
jgi:hypothetical protein